MITPTDIEARQKAIDAANSYCVTAPAGSGKTELLTQRFLNLLARVDKPEQVLALTFTRKAAAEMRERIFQSLQRAARDEHPAEAHEQLTFELAKRVLKTSEDKSWNILTYPLRLRIQTLDSLCQSIVKDQPLLSGSGGSLQPRDDPNSLYAKAIDNLFEEVNSDRAESAVKDSLLLLLRFVDNRVDRLRELLTDMLPVRDQWLVHAGVFKSTDDRKEPLELILKRRVEQALSHARQEAKPYEGLFVQAAVFAAEHIDQLGQDSEAVSLIGSLRNLEALPDAKQSSFRQWQAFLELLFTRDFKPRSRLVSKQGFPPKSFFKKNPDALERCQQHKEALMAMAESIASDGEKLRHFRAIASLPLSGYDEEQLKLLEAMVSCLFRLVAHLKLVFLQEGASDHLEVTSLALQALSDQTVLPDGLPDAGIAYRWSEKFHHILVDEFQDTSISQFELLKALSSEWPSYNALNHQAPKTVFVVGDGMQSIYSFRAARVGLFLRVREQGIGDLDVTPLYLTQNFRSEPAIVNWVNTHFEKAFPISNEQNSGAVRFERATAMASTENNGHHKGSVSTRIFLAPESETEQKAVDVNRAEAEAIVDFIAQEQRDNPDADIAILVRARSHLSEILGQLNQKRISWEGVDIDALSGRESIMDCMTLTRALLNPADDVAWYALLRSPLCGVKLADLQLLADLLKQSAGQLDLPQILTNFKLFKDSISAVSFSSLDEYERLSHFIVLLEGIYLGRGQSVLSDWLLQAWLQLGGDELARSIDESDAVHDYFLAIENLCQMADHRGDRVTYSDIQREVDRLYASAGSTSDTGTMQSTSSKPVRLMTVHKSKGLEFDTVILPQLHRAPASDSGPILISNEYLFDDGTSGLLLYPREKRALLERDNRNRDKTLYDHLLSEKKYALELESCRLLYVAATRAKRQLLLTACLPENIDAETGLGKARKPGSRSLLAKLWSTLSESAQLVNPVSDQSEHSSILTADDEVSVNTTARIKRFQLAFSGNRLDRVSVGINRMSEPEVPAQAPLHQVYNTDAISQKSVIAQGLFVHEFMELVACDGLAFWRDYSLEGLRETWSVRLQQLGCPRSALDTSLERVLLIADAVLSSDYCTWLFDSAHAKPDNEWRLAASKEGTSERLVVDRSFIDSSGCRWIIDYKTAEPTDGQTIDGFLQQQVERYSEQLNRYRKAIIAYDQHENPSVHMTRSALYFPLIDRAVELSES